jgi:hypothetical protein
MWCTNKFNIQQFTLCLHCIFAICNYLRTNGDLCRLHHNLIGFITEKKGVYCVVRTGALNKIVGASFLKG